MGSQLFDYTSGTQRAQYAQFEEHVLQEWNVIVRSKLHAYEKWIREGRDEYRYTGGSTQPTDTQSKTNFHSAQFFCFESADDYLNTWKSVWISSFNF